MRLSASHTVTFAESSNGELQVIERKDPMLDHGQPSLSGFAAPGVTLASLHRHLLPAAPVPPSLLEADGRAAARLPAAPDPTPPGAAASRDAQSSSPPAIDWDWQADAAWFAEHYATGGTDGFFAANALHISQTRLRSTSWYKVSAFNQSFDSSAFFVVKSGYACGAALCWSTKLATSVAPRAVVTYFATGDHWRQSWMDGSGPSPRVALSARWVPSSPPAPLN